MQLTEVARHLGTAVIREPRGLLRGYGQGGPDLCMFRPANYSNRKIVIDITVASSVQAKSKSGCRPQVAGRIIFGCRGIVI